MTHELYKSRDIHSREYRQLERRRKLLDEQRQHRNESVDECRNFEQLKDIFCAEENPNRRRSKNSQKNQLMLSEWLRELPNDIDRWYIKPCPKGIRVLVVAANQSTKVYNKYGGYMHKFRSQLPGGHDRRELTILDCIYVEKLQQYYVLDILAYRNQSLTHCETEFRFFWIDSHIRDCNVDEVTKDNARAFKIIERFDCGDDVAVNQVVSMYPIWPNGPELDGFLFYHKEASYVHGTTPLLGWLFAFMMPDFFDCPNMHDRYMDEKPADYMDPSTFMEEFDRKIREKQTQRNQRYRQKQRERHRPADAMDEGQTEEINKSTEIDDENSTVSIMKQAMELEMGGDEFDREDDAFS